MASGKTTMASHLEQGLNFEIISMAGEVKRVGRELFGMTKKDRPLLQQIGMKMREIRESVWLDAVIQQEDGWLLVKLDIAEDLQKSRLQNTYGDDWEVHWNNRTDPSEAEVDKIPLDWFDVVIQASDDESPIENLMKELIIGIQEVQPKGQT